VPAGVLELIRASGAQVVSSSDFVTDLASKWSPEELAGHRRAAASLKSIALAAFAHVRAEFAAGRTPTEYGVQQWVLEAMARDGLFTNDPPIVATGANAANPHYEPKREADVAVRKGEVLLIDLWGGVRVDTVYADQTWMAFVGRTPPAEVARVWTVVRDARDRAVAVLRERWKAGAPVSGADLDDATREVIADAGFGASFVHRTGHSIDKDLHGSGPHLDNYETHDDRLLAPGVGFSVEPGIYLTGRFGVRSEINVVMHAEGPEVTPEGPQQELVCLDVPGA
jgi:Xaa-Pro dipeptidase